MKKMMLEFKDEEYDVIPRPKRTWVMRVLRKELANSLEVNRSYEIEWAFRIGTYCLKSKAVQKGYAFLNLGFTTSEFDKIYRSGTLAEAKSEGWWDENRVVADKAALEADWNGTAPQPQRAGDTVPEPSAWTEPLANGSNPLDV